MYRRLPLFLAAVAFVGVLLTAPRGAHSKPLSERVLWLGFGGSGGVAAGDFGGVSYLNFTLGVRLLPVVPEVTLREGMRGQAEVQTHVSGVAVSARFLLPKLLAARGFLRVGFSHQNEAPWATFLDSPGETLFGVGDGIDRRSGFEAGGGLELKLGPKGIVGLWLQGTALVFPLTDGPPVTIIAEGGLSFGLGPKLGG